MSRTLFALLIGIDAYEPPMKPLRGCCNDIDAIDAWLRSRAGATTFRYAPLILKNAQATRQAVIDGFGHLRQAGSNDVAVLYYSGHGSHEPAPPEWWHLEPDQRNETLVCYDSRTAGRYDLADKELAKLIAGVAARDPHLVMILDCCHSASGTRGEGDEPTDARSAPDDDRRRPLESFIVSTAEAEALAPQTRAADAPAMAISAPGGKHMLLAACRADEEAREYRDGDQRRGVFSYFLTQTLHQAQHDLSYRDLFERTSALVRKQVNWQAPQIEAHGVSLDQPFLGGPHAARSPYFSCSFDPVFGWVINGGALHQLQPPTADDTTELALFPFDATPDQLRDPAAVLGVARITALRPELSQVALTLNNGTPDPATTYKAIVTSVPLVPTFVQLSGEPRAVEQVRAALATASETGDASLFVREARAGETARIEVMAADNQYIFVQHNERDPRLEPIAGWDEAAARRVMERLEHLARWWTLADLHNPGSRLAPAAVTCDLFAAVGPAPTRDPLSAPFEQLNGSDHTLRYSERDGQALPPQFRLRLRNTSAEPLYCMLLNLTQRGAIMSGLLPGGGVWLQPGQEAWSPTSATFTARVPDELWQRGITTYHDLLKLIVTTTQADATLLDQGPFDAGATRNAARSAPVNTLDRLMRRVVTRDIGTQMPDPLTAWTTGAIRITTERPLHENP